MVGSAARRAGFAFTALVSFGLFATGARAIELGPNGEVQIHGYAEMQLRAIDNGFSEEMDLAQWYNIINVEVEADIASDGWWIFDLIEAYVRAEGRYDCIYTRGCGMFRSADAYGNRTNHIPRRLRDAVDRDVAGVIPTGLPPVFRIQNEKPADLFTYRDTANLDYIDPADHPGDPRFDPSSPSFWPELLDPRFNPETIREVADRQGFPGLGGLFSAKGPDGLDESDDDPARYVLESVLGFKFYLQETTGRVLTGGTRILGPVLPKNDFTNLAALRDKANPFRGERTPTLVANFRVDPALDPRLAGLTSHNIRLRTPAEADSTSMTFGQGVDSQGNPISNDDKFRGFSGDFSGVVPYYENKLVNEKDFNNGTRTASVLAQLGEQNMDGNAGVFSLFPDSNVYIIAGTGELPLRPAPDRAVLDPTGNNRLLNAQGLYVPSRGLRHALRTQDFDTHPFNISEDKRAWNRGDSQDDEKEVKEAFLDLEMFDSRLWWRIGKQNIVWGKTELFRTTDQFNPQDLALASIPALEESRIALWSSRWVWSFYQVGPLEDVRAEFAVNFDDFQPADLGGCGEPYTFDVVCGLTLGLAAHGFAGIGVAGVDRPPDPWKSTKGLEYGGRLEWRWDRFSFALTDFYGFDDFPYADQISFYSRAVDLETGRPLIMPMLTDRQGSCVHPTPGTVGDGSGRTYDDAAAYQSMTPSGIGSDPDCLKAGGAANGQNVNQYGGVQNALQNHPANLGLFSVICASQLGVSSLAPSNCNLNVFQSTGTPDEALFSFGLVELLTTFFAGEPLTQQFYRALTKAPRNDLVTGGANGPIVALNRDGGVSDPSLIPRDTPNCRSIALDGCDPDNDNSWSWNGLGGRGSDGVITARDPAINIPIGGSFVFPLPGGGTATLDCTNFGQLRFGTGINIDRCRESNLVTQYDDQLTLDSTLTNAQRILIGCGPLAGTRCDSAELARSFKQATLEFEEVIFPEGGGIDLLLTDASFALQAFVGIEGTERLSPENLDEWAFALANPDVFANTGAMDNVKDYGDRAITSTGGVRLTNACQFVRDESDPTARPLADDLLQVDAFANCTSPVQPTWLTTSAELVQPGAIRLGDGEMFPLGATCTYYNEKTGGVTTLPGCRGIETFRIQDVDMNEIPDAFLISFEQGYLPSIDGCVLGRDTAQQDANDVALDIAGVPVDVQLADGTPVDVRSAADGNTDDSYGGELGRQLAACADQMGNRFTSSTRISSVPGSGQSVDIWTSASTLFHPLAGCRVQGNLQRDNTPLDDTDNRATYQIGGGVDDGESCNVVLRDFIQNFNNDPMSVQMFRSEGAALSFNIQMFLVATSCNGDKNDEIRLDPECFDVERPYRPDRCSFAAPQLCDNVKGFLNAGGVQRNTVLAGGKNGRGRRSFPWHQGGEAMIRYKKRNVLGFSLDFAEDVTKSNVGMEFTWISSHPAFNNDSLNNVSNIDTMNMTVSIDRPTFINFLNANRTFFFNTQWFLQYIANYRQGMLRTGPFNVLFTFAVFTGYYQDRLLPTFISIYDFGSRSGGFLPSVGYRFTENFSATLGFNIFFGRDQTGPMPVRGLGPAGNATNPESLKYKATTQNFISNIRKRDEVFMRVRWTF